MKTFYVHMREVHIQTMRVQAESKKDAIQFAQEGEGECLEFEYSHTLDPETWTVEEKGGS